VTLFERLYRLLLHLYPAAHRAEYGDLMTIHFRDLMREARTRGMWRIAKLWLRLLLDVARTAPAEHLATARETIMDLNPRGTEPLPWWQIALVVLPGLTALPGLLTGDGTWLAYAGVMAALLAAVIHWQRAGHFPAWGLLLLGYLAIVGLAIAASVVNTVMPGLPVPRAVLIGLLVAAGLAAAVRIGVRHARVAGLPGWLLPALGGMALIAFAAGALSAIHSTMVAGEPPGAHIRDIVWLGVWGMSFLAVKLIAVMLGLPLARRHGLTAILFVVGFVYPIYSGIENPAYAISLWTDSRLLIWTVELAVPALMLVVGPLWSLRAGSGRWRALGLLLPVCVALTAGTLISGVVRPYHIGVMVWLASSLDALNNLFVLVVAAGLYRHAAAPGDAGAENRAKLPSSVLDPVE
jgi:hypothetical protein